MFVGNAQSIQVKYKFDVSQITAIFQFFFLICSWYLVEADVKSGTVVSGRTN